MARMGSSWARSRKRWFEIKSEPLLLEVVLCSGMLASLFALGSGEQVASRMFMPVSSISIKMDSQEVYPLFTTGEKWGGVQLNVEFPKWYDLGLLIDWLLKEE